ncbi:MAG: hypothetical protein JXN65_10170 [Clostridia bacterium]|nr:hypothetical protein [Clostridia bacterium]
MERIIENELMQDEQILWNGQPSGRLFRTADLLFFPATFFGVFFIYLWIKLSFTAELPVFAYLILAFLTLQIIYMGIGRFFYKSYLNRNTYYYVTDRRILILKDTMRRKLIALDIISLPIIEKKVNRDGFGSLYFGELVLASSIYANSGMDFYARPGLFTCPIPPAFFDLSDAAQVYSIINRVKAKSHDNTTQA